MRLSCNGCRVLRKGCSENCSIKPCLQWIKSPEAQSNATLFLAKFYGRAGLINLINSGPEHTRPGIFRSLLYEACGRIVNPIYGSTGLLTSGNWQLCQAAVEAVLSGAPIVKLSPDSAAASNNNNTAMMSPSLKACDIRHVSKGTNSACPDLHKVKTRAKFKRVSAAQPKKQSSAEVDDAARVILSWCSNKEEEIRSPSHDSGLSQQHTDEPSRGESADVDSGSVETVEASLVAKLDESDVGLELTLGFCSR